MKKENKNLILIDDVNVWDKNPREISSKDFESLKKKIERWGIWKPFLVWESKKQILGGNQRYKACKELGHKEIWVEYREPKDDAEALEMAIADNESSGEWIKSLLIEQIKLNEDKIELEDYKINIKDTTLKDLMPIDAEEDNPPDEADVQSVSVLGDLYELGNHRVLCGDSTSVDNVEKLMNGKKADMVFTDPPYGAGFEFKNDDENFLQTFADFYSIIPCDENIYVCCDFRCIGEFYEVIKKKHQVYNLIVWVKNLFGQGKLYHTKHEEIIFCGSGNFESKNSNNDENVWSADSVRNFGGSQNAKEAVGHPTQKPIEICTRAIRNSSNKDSYVYDGFLGSGSTLIACEKTERICYGMELDTHYTDVIVARYIKYMQDNGKLFTIKRNGEEIDYNLFLKDGK